MLLRMLCVETIFKIKNNLKLFCFVSFVFKQNSKRHRLRIKSESVSLVVSHFHNQLFAIRFPTKRPKSPPNKDPAIPPTPGTGISS